MNQDSQKRYLSDYTKEELSKLSVDQVQQLFMETLKEIVEVSESATRHINQLDEYRKKAEQLLKENNYPEDKIQFVKKCILNHSSKRAEFRTTEEERILVDADGLSHFDSINNLYNLAHNVMELNDDDTIRFIQDKLTKDYNEIIDALKYLIQDKYDRVMNTTDINDILIGGII